MTDFMIFSLQVWDVFSDILFVKTVGNRLDGSNEIGLQNKKIKNNFNSLGKTVYICLITRV